MDAVKINVNVDKKTKQEADAVFKELGLNMSTAINMFLKKSVMEGGIPFDVTISKPKRETLDAIKEAAERTGARKVFLEEEPKVAAIGAGMDISKPSANMVIDIGGSFFA